MAEVVNLRRVRKVKLRDNKAALAQSNRVLHGVAKSTHNLAKARAQKAKSVIEAHKLDKSPN